MSEASMRPEFSFIVAVDELSTADRVVQFSANEKERQALAERFNVDGISRLEGRATLKLLSDGDVLMKLEAQAGVQQRCVVTLEPLETEISVDFSTTYTDSHNTQPGLDWGHDEEVFEDIDDDIEPPESMYDGKIDVAEACVEQLALEIDPFPRVKGVTFDGYSTDPEGLSVAKSEKPNPFAKLSELKLKQQSDDD